MNIAYDIFIRNPELVIIANEIPEIDEGLWELLQFVKGRLMPLSSQIDKEEDDNPDETKGTIIMLQPPPETPTRFLLFGGYSQPLLNKMEASFSQQDMEYIFKKLEAILNKWQQ